MSPSSIARQRDLSAGTAHPKSSPSLLKSGGTLNSLANRNSRSNPRASRRSSSIYHIPSDKPSLTGPYIGLKRSSSSGPRGRSSSPSEFIRVFRDSSGKKGELRGSRIVSSAGKMSGTKTLSDCKENVIPFPGKCEEGPGSGSNISKVEVGNINLAKYDLIADVSVESIGSEKTDLNLKSVKADNPRSSTEDPRAKFRDLESSKERRLSDEGGRRGASVKYSSKLQEKLAFLEGKVKRIASDIKKTKEMLDISNPESSKLMLLDIQEKISGIEKVIGHVGDESSKTMSDDVADNSIGEASLKKEAEEPKGSVKNLSTVELEARLFTHHKLLRNRITKNPNGISETTESKLVGCDSHNSMHESKTSIHIGNTLPDKGGAESSSKTTKHLDSYSSAVESGDSASTEVNENTSSRNDGMEDLALFAEEKFEDFDDGENINVFSIDEGMEDASDYQLNKIGTKRCTGGWFVSEGDSVLLAHDDGSCTFYDIANCEEKSVYKAPDEVSPNIWADCWIVRAAGSDGCSGKFVVAASAGKCQSSGFCSWDFYTKSVRAFHTEKDESRNSKAVLSSFPSNTTNKRNSLSTLMSTESQAWWYKPCGALMAAASCGQRLVKVFDIRDGEKIMDWQTQKLVAAMDYSSPLQWRNRGKVVLAEAETVSVWDVNSQFPLPLLSISYSGRKISALHVINTDAELGGGVRQRVSSAEAEGNDGVFCTNDAINVMDFRHPSGVVMKIPKIGNAMHCAYTRGDAVYVGCSKLRLTNRNQQSPQVLQFSLRKQKQVCCYALPESNAAPYQADITQVWGNSDTVMATSGLGLFVFDAERWEESDGCDGESGGCNRVVREVVGPDDLCSPSFDYMASQALLVSKDRPALWKTLALKATRL